MSEIIATDKRLIRMRIDEDVYSLESVKKACYAIMALASCEITKIEGGGGLEVLLYVVKDTNHSDAEISQVLLDELLDYSLRESIAEQTEDVRNVILANAFSRSRLVG